MAWSLALCLDDTKQDPVVYGAEFSVVFLAKGPVFGSRRRIPSLSCPSSTRALTVLDFLLFSPLMFTPRLTAVYHYGVCLKKNLNASSLQYIVAICTQSLDVKLVLSI